jgi:hypothetical protein
MAVIQPYETRTLRPGPGLTPEQRAFAAVHLDYTDRQPLLQLVFGNLYYELPDALARDFGARIARAAETRIPAGSRRSFRCAPGTTRQDREFVEVLLQDDETRTWLRLEFHDGNTVDFSVALGVDFARRLARAMKALPSPPPGDRP